MVCKVKDSSSSTHSICLLFSQDNMASRLCLQLQKEADKLKKHICQNMFDVLEKHREYHRIMQKLHFFKTSSVFAKNLSQSN